MVMVVVLIPTAEGGDGVWGGLRGVHIQPDHGDLHGIDPQIVQRELIGRRIKQGQIVLCHRNNIFPMTQINV